MRKVSRLARLFEDRIMSASAYPTCLFRFVAEGRETLISTRGIVFPSWNLQFCAWAQRHKDEIWAVWCKEDVVQLQADVCEYAYADVYDKRRWEYYSYNWYAHGTTRREDYPQYDGNGNGDIENAYFCPRESRVWDRRKGAPRESRLATALWLYTSWAVSKPEIALEGLAGAEADPFTAPKVYEVVLEDVNNALYVSMIVFDKDGNAVPDLQLNEVPIEDAITQIKVWENQGDVIRG